MLEWTLPFLTGLFSAGHCIGMCGGIVAAYSMGTATEHGTLTPHLLYNGGRITSYSLLGGLFGAIGPQAEAGGLAHLLFGAVLLTYGLAALGVTRLQRLVHMEPPAWLFARLGPLIKNSSALRPLLLGLVSGLLPCALLMAMQIQAMASGSTLAGMLLLASFGLGTALPLFSLGLLTTRLTPTSRQRLMQMAGLLILVMAGLEFEKSWHLLTSPVPPIGHCHGGG